MPWPVLLSGCPGAGGDGRGVSRGEIPGHSQAALTVHEGGWSVGPPRVPGLGDGLRLVTETRLYPGVALLPRHSLTPHSMGHYVLSLLL